MDGRLGTNPCVAEHGVPPASPTDHQAFLPKAEESRNASRADVAPEGKGGDGAVGGAEWEVSEAVILKSQKQPSHTAYLQTAGSPDTQVKGGVQTPEQGPGCWLSRCQTAGFQLRQIQR